MPKTYKSQTTYHGCIIRQRGSSFQVETNRNGQRNRTTFKSLQEARVFAKQKETELKNEGTLTLSLNPSHRLDAAKAIALIPAGLTLEKIVSDYVEASAIIPGISMKAAATFFQTQHKPAEGSSTVADLILEYLAKKEKDNRRKLSIQDIHYRLGKFSTQYGAQQVYAITSLDIETWLDSNKYTGQSRINYLRVFSGFFNYALRKRLIKENPADKSIIQRPKLDEKIPAIFSVADVKKLLLKAHDLKSSVVPYLSIGFFAGLRSAEIEGLKWEDINFREKLITIRPEVAKMRRQRHVEMSENLLEWLRPYQNLEGRLYPKKSKIRGALEPIVKAAQISWVHNGMRHTFASCHLAAHKDISKTTLELGHTGNAGVLFNHYRNLVKPADATAYWKIIPQAEEALTTETTKEEPQPEPDTHSES